MLFQPSGAGAMATEQPNSYHQRYRAKGTGFLHEERRGFMIIPNILYYARMDYDTTSQKTPKYVVEEQAGFYPPMEAITGRNGKISMYLREKLRENENSPSMWLQAKDSLNFTGLKDYFIGGKLSGFAYGYPLADKTYSSKNKQNPFYNYKDDGFLFIVHQNQTTTTEADKIRPSYIELLVLDGAKVLIPSYCKMLQMGGFDDALKLLREQARKANVL